MVRVYELISDNSRDPFKVSIVDSGTYDTTISYPGSSTLNQGDSPITPTIIESGDFIIGGSLTGVTKIPTSKVSAK